MQVMIKTNGVIDVLIKMGIFYDQGNLLKILKKKFQYLDFDFLEIYRCSHTFSM